jgi:hypothetical protein
VLTILPVDFGNHYPDAKGRGIHQQIRKD